MKTTIFYLSFVLLLVAGMPAQAQQETYFEKIEKLEKQKEQIRAEEKAALKKEVERINELVEEDKIDWEEADRLKGEAAVKHAENIKNRIAIVDNQIALLSRDAGNQKESWASGNEDWDQDSRNWKKETEDRTSMYLVLAAGFNNALYQDQSLNDSEFELGGSRFFEIGLAWRTRVFNNSNWLRLKYGFSFQFNGLKPTDNRYFVQDGDEVALVEYPLDLDKSKFRMDNLVFPVHFEFGPSRRVESDDRIWFSTRKRLRIGLGGFAGFNLGERQKLKYSLEGEDVKQKLKGDYNTNDLIYGLSAYIGWGGTSLYAKYDLNPIFDEPNAELYNMSLGLRFDLN